MKTVERSLPKEKVQSYFVEMAKWLHKDFGILFEQNLDGGGFFSIVPESLEREWLMKLDAGGILPEGKEFRSKGYRLVEKRTLEQEFAQKLSAAVHQHGTSIVGFDALISKSDFPDGPSLDLSKPPFGIFEGSARNLEAIREFINQFASAWKTVILVVQKPSHVKTPRDLALSTVLFAVSAYDGESFAYWQRQERP